MKLTVEVDEKTFKYGWVIGEETQNGESPVSAKSLVLFVDLLREAVKRFDANREEKFQEKMRKAYTEVEKENAH